MSRHWEAPRTAYELAADWAERAAAGSGSARGQFVPPPGMGKLWLDMRAAERRDVIDALAMQARSAVYEYTKRAGFHPDEPLAVHDAGFSPRMCEQAVDALRELASPSGGEWNMPECQHCASLLAEALINIEVTAFLEIGIADPQVMLRMMAEGGVRVPEHRKAPDDADG